MNPNQYNQYQQPVVPPPNYQAPNVPVGLPPYKAPGNGKTIGLIVAAVLAVIFAGAFAWALSNYFDQRNNVDSIAEERTKTALSAQEEKLQNEFRTTQEQDTVLFQGPDILGSVGFAYPKTWSAYVETAETGTELVDVTIHPVAVTNTTAAFALRFQIINQPYASVVDDYDSDVKKGDLTSKAVEHASLKGIRLTGKIDAENNGVLVFLPLRDKTISLWTESNNYLEVYEQALKTLQLIP